mgnify:CR=1 FL=1
MTNEEILEAKRLAEAATPGPWSAECLDEDLDIWQVPEALVSASADADYANEANARFHATSRMLVPALADDLLKARRELGDTRRLLRETCEALEAAEQAVKE